MNQESPSPARRMFAGDAGSAVESFYLLDDRQIVRTVIISLRSAARSECSF
jgi:hypothetical protein